MKESITKYDFKEGLPQEFEILELNNLITHFPEKICTPHRVAFYQIIWFTKGTPTLMVDFNSIKIQPNTLLFINKNSVQQFDQNLAFDGKIILFTDHFFGKEESDTTFLKNTILFNDLLSIASFSVSKISTLFNTILFLIHNEQKKTKDDYQPEIIRNLLKNFLYTDERERKKQNFIPIKPSQDLQLVMHFKKDLEQYFKQKKQVAQYAEKLAITKKD